MTVSFMLSVDYPGRHSMQGDMGYVDVDVTDKELQLLRKWIDESGDVSDYPELDRVWKYLYTEGREMLEASYDEMAPQERENSWDIEDLEIIIQYPDLDDPDPFLSDLKKYVQYIEDISK